MASEVILGVDGGGTKTVACVASVNPDGIFQVLGRGSSGSSNLRAVGAQRAFENLGEAIGQAWAQAGMTAQPAQVAVLGLAGASRPNIQQEVETWMLTRQLARKVLVVHDGLPVLAAGSDDGCGVALIAGTGAVAWGGTPDGTTAVAGGWGYLFGDEGSAFWIGQEALRCVAHAADGRCEPTQLTAVLLDTLGIAESRKILETLQQQGDVRCAIACLAPVVCDVAELDSAAAAILDRAAEHLAALAGTVAKRLQLDRRFSLACAGGALSGCTLLRERVLGNLRQRQWTPEPVTVVTDPVQGCLRLAVRHLGKHVR